MASPLRTVPVPRGYEAIKALAAADGGGMLQRNEFRFLLKNKAVDLPCHQFWSQISDVELKQIISAVMNRGWWVRNREDPIPSSSAFAFDHHVYAAFCQYQISKARKPHRAIRAHDW